MDTNKIDEITEFLSYLTDEVNLIETYKFKIQDVYEKSKKLCRYILESAKFVALNFKNDQQDIIDYIAVLCGSKIAENAEINDILQL